MWLGSWTHLVRYRRDEVEPKPLREVLLCYSFRVPFPDTRLKVRPRKHKTELEEDIEGKGEVNKDVYHEERLEGALRLGHEGDLIWGDERSEAEENGSQCIPVRIPFRAARINEKRGPLSEYDLAGRRELDLVPARRGGESEERTGNAGVSGGSLPVPHLPP